MTAEPKPPLGLLMELSPYIYDEATVRRAYVRGIAHGCLVLATALPMGGPNELISWKQGLILHLMAAENVTQREIKEIEPGQWGRIKDLGGWI